MFNHIYTKSFIVGENASITHLYSAYINEFSIKSWTFIKQFYRTIDSQSSLYSVNN